VVVVAIEDWEEGSLLRVESRESVVRGVSWSNIISFSFLGCGLEILSLGIVLKFLERVMYFVDLGLRDLLEVRWCSREEISR